MALLSFDWLLNVALCSLLFSEFWQCSRWLLFLGVPFVVWGSSTPEIGLILVLRPVWSPVELFLGEVPRVVPVLREPRAMRHSHGALPSRLRPGRGNTMSSWSVFLKPVQMFSKVGQPICTFSDAKGTNGPTAKGATGKGSIFAHSPRLRTSLLRESDLKPTSLDFQQMKDYQK